MIWSKIALPLFATHVLHRLVRHPDFPTMTSLNVVPASDERGTLFGHREDIVDTLDALMFRNIEAALPSEDVSPKIQREV